MGKNKSKELPKIGNNKLPHENLANIPPDIQSIINQLGIDDPQKKQILAIALSRTFFSGPIPPPELLKQYNEIMQNGADRIVSMAENQSKHRMDLEKSVVTEELKQSKRGQIFGLTLVIFCIILAFILSITNHETVAGILAGSTVVSLATVFVFGKQAQKKNLDNKK